MTAQADAEDHVQSAIAFFKTHGTSVSFARTAAAKAEGLLDKLDSEGRVEEEAEPADAADILGSSDAFLEFVSGFEMSIFDFENAFFDVEAS